MWEFVWRRTRLARKEGKLTKKIELEWTDQHMLIQADCAKLLCLLSCETVVLIKSGNVEQHKKTKHGSLEEIYLYIRCGESAQNDRAERC